MSLLTWCKTQWFLFGKLFVMLKCVLDSPMSFSAQVWEHIVDSWPGNPSLKKTPCTQQLFQQPGAIPAFPAPILRDSCWGLQILNCWGALLVVPLHADLWARSQGLVSHPLRPPCPCQCKKHQGPAERRAQSPRALQACREAAPIAPQDQKSHGGQGIYHLQASSGEEHIMRGSERKFHPMKERTETQVLDITVNCTKLIPHKKQMKTTANGQWPNTETTYGHFFSIKSLHSQYLNGKVKEGKALPCSGSFYGTQTTVHAVILGFCASLLFRGGFVQCWGVAGCSGGRLLSFPQPGSREGAAWEFSQWKMELLQGQF